MVIFKYRNRQGDSQQGANHSAVQCSAVHGPLTCPTTVKRGQLFVILASLHLYKIRIEKRGDMAQKPTYISNL